MNTSDVIFLTEHPHRLNPGDANILFHTFRGPGPGGQKKNKTSSAVRAVHSPTGLIAICGDHREQSRNKALALRRLRLKLTLHCRHPLNLDTAVAPPDFSPSVSPNAAHYLSSLGYALDVLHATDYVIAPAARHLHITTSALSNLLTSTPEALTHINHQRALLGLRPLKP